MRTIVFEAIPGKSRDSSAISTGVAVLLSAVITPVRASVQTGEARPNHGLTTVVTGHGLRYAVEISEHSRNSAHIYPHVSEHGG